MVDLAEVRTRADFGEALDELRGDRSYRHMAKRATELNPARPLPAQGEWRRQNGSAEA
jgi:hypothetical protein